MKTYLKVFLGGLALMLFLSTTCEEEDPCEDTKLEENVDVDYYCWGTATFVRINDGADVTAAFKGTHFRVKFNKVYCSNKKSNVFEYLYYMLEDGTLDKVGMGTIGFTMQNSLDVLDMTAYVITPFGVGDVRLGQSRATENYWSVGKVRTEMDIEIWVDEVGNAIWASGSADFYYQ